MAFLSGSLLRPVVSLRDLLRGRLSFRCVGASNDNLVWDGDHLLAIHDWDSVICQPEPAIAGFAAATCLGLGGPQGPATVEQSATFLDAYVQARGVHWDTADSEAAWAAGLWVVLWTTTLSVAFPGP